MPIDFSSMANITAVSLSSRCRPASARPHTALPPQDGLRTITYEFSEDILRLPTIGTELVFKVGARQPVRDFRMIERHYFRDQLIKSYDFEFGFVIPK